MGHVIKRACAGKCFPVQNFVGHWEINVISALGLEE
jgi:hypothetical protein